MTIKLSDKASAQLSKQNANYVVAQMINVFELDLSKPKPKTK